MAFTDLQIKNLKPREKDYILFEGRGDGLAIRVRASGQKTWCMFYHFGGKRRQLTIGSYATHSLADARLKAREARALLPDKDPALMKAMKIETTQRDREGLKRRRQEERSALTVEGLVARFIDSRGEKGRRPRTVAEYRRQLDCYINGWMGEVKAKALTRPEVLRFQEHLHQHRGPIIANRVLALLASAYNWGVSRGDLKENPALRVPKTVDEEERARDRALERDEVGIFWRVLLGEEVRMWPEVKAALRLVLLTGARPGEVSGMEWEEIKADGYWEIPKGRAKDGEARRLWLSSLAWEQIGGRPARGEKRTGPVFPSPKGGGALDRNELSKQRHRNQAHFEDAGIKEPFTPHDLRRTAATHWGRLKVERGLIKLLLGHKETGVTWKYNRHDYEDENRVALNRWGEEVAVLAGLRKAGKVVRLPSARE